MSAFSRIKDFVTSIENGDGDFLKELDKKFAEFEQKMQGSKKINMKTYQKTITVQAEQFDGSEKMMNRYGIEKKGNSEFYLPNDISPNLFFESNEVKISDWIIVDDNGQVQSMPDKDFKNDYHEIQENRNLYVVVFDEADTWGCSNKREILDVADELYLTTPYLGVNDLLELTTIEEFSGIDWAPSAVVRTLTLREALENDFFDNCLEEEFWTKLGVDYDVL